MRSCQRCLDRVEEYLREGRAQPSADPLVADIGALDRAVDEDTAGSLSGRRHALRVRRVSGLLLELIALTSGWGTANRGAPMGRSGSAEQRILGLTALARAGNQPSLANALDEVLQVLRGPAAVMFGRLLRDFDTSSVVRAALRPIIAVAIAVSDLVEHRLADGQHDGDDGSSVRHPVLQPRRGQPDADPGSDWFGARCACRRGSPSVRAALRPQHSAHSAVHRPVPPAGSLADAAACDSEVGDRSQYDVLADGAADVAAGWDPT